MNRDIRRGIIFATAVASAYAIGAYMGHHNIWPLPQIKDAIFPDKSFGRLVSFPGKQNIACPPQTPSTRVLLIAGQSNAANKGGQRFASAHGGKVINFFAGNCTIAQSPLLGSEGANGEYWTPLGDALIEAGADQVILIPAAIFATPIRRWAADGDLNPMLLASVDGAQSRYRITDIVWDQGEEDYAKNTSGADYAKAFRSMLASLRAHGVTAPIFVSVATRCNTTPWNSANPIAEAQRALPDAALGIYAGIDTDALMTPLDRYDDCHLGATGQGKAVSAWAKILGAPRHL